jgi:hypothetical protein
MEEPGDIPDPKIHLLATDESIPAKERKRRLEEMYVSASEVDKNEIAGYCEMLYMHITAEQAKD